MDAEAAKRFVACLKTRNIVEVTGDPESCALCGEAVLGNLDHAIFKRRRDAEMVLLRRDR